MFLQVTIRGILIGIIISAVLVGIVSFFGYDGGCGAFDPTGGMGMGSYEPQCTFIEYIFNINGYYSTLSLILYAFWWVIPIIVALSIFGNYFFLQSK